MSRWMKRGGAQRPPPLDPFARIVELTREGTEAVAARPIQVAPPINPRRIPSPPVRDSHREFLLRQHGEITERLKTRGIRGACIDLPAPFTKEQGEYYAACRDATRNRTKT